MLKVATWRSSFSPFKSCVPCLNYIEEAFNVLRGACASTCREAHYLDFQGITLARSGQPKPKPNPATLVFGKEFTDHMLTINWDASNGWNAPKIVPFGNLSLSPASSVLHYATECIEGMKAYRGVDGQIRLFRPQENIKRLSTSAGAVCLPEFDEAELLECIKHLVHTDRDWVPEAKDCSLYIRPTFIGTHPAIGVAPSQSALLYCIMSPVGPYFRKSKDDSTSSTFSAVTLFATSQYVRAWPGGVGDRKLGANYGPTIRVQKIAESKGCNQVLWLLGKDEQITEAGTMNCFVHWINEDGEPEIATPPLLGTILDGVVRKSALDLARTWGTHKVTERNISMTDVRRAVKEKRMKEMFGSGTACVICPISRILHYDQHINVPTMDNGAEVARRLYQELTDIQYGVVPHRWAEVVHHY